MPILQRNRFKIAALAAIVVLLFSVQTSFGQQTINWSTKADSLRGRNGQQFTFVCPANGSLSNTVWGTDVYTDDSAICAAAVHAGLISIRNGGGVTIEIRPGAGSYSGTERNGVNARAYGAYSGSFIFVRGQNGVGGGDNAMSATWATQADSLRGQNGQRFTLGCPAGGSSGRLWGTDVYTNDSSICTAAVHAGIINTVNGGSVTIEIRPGESSYRATSRNGVASRSYGSWPGSFIFIESQSGGGGGGGGGGGDNAVSATWATQADSLRGRNGQRFTFVCPANGVISGRLWGTGLYTDDSSICAAAVHAGLITASIGGTVTIEIRPGAASYQTSTSNGVASRSYGSWPGSFVFVR